jgi:hypothetical protein
MLCDDPKFLGGNDPTLGGFIPGNTHAIPVGVVKPALIETGEYRHNPGGLSMVTGFRPLVDGNSPLVAARIKSRDATSGSLDESPLIQINPRTGMIDQRVSARYHRYEVVVTGDFTSIHGGEPEVSTAQVR